MLSFNHEERNSAKGAILLLAMVFLLLLALLGMTSMRASTLEFRMAGNTLFKEEARQAAQGVIAAIADNGDNFSASGPVGHTICKAGDVDEICDRGHRVVETFSRGQIPAGVEVSYQVERMGPLLLESPPVRVSEDRVSSSLAFEFAIFEVRAGVDGHKLGLGQALLAQGIAQLKASSKGAGAE